jgi:hypothetical protein
LFEQNKRKEKDFMNIKDFKRGDWLFFGSVACGILAVLTGSVIPIATVILGLGAFVGVVIALLLKKSDG